MEILEASELLPVELVKIPDRFSILVEVITSPRFDSSKLGAEPFSYRS
jgi:hypothetical protein